MSFRYLAARLLQHGRQFVGVWSKQRYTTQVAVEIAKRGGDGGLSRGGWTALRAGGNQDQSFATAVVRRLLGRVWDGPATAEIRKHASRWIQRQGNPPILAFVGVAMGTGSGMVTKRDEMESVCEEIRGSMSYLFWEKFGCASSSSDDLKKDQEIDRNLEDLEIGDVIAKGCNAIVHAAKWKNQPKSESCENSVISRETSPLSNLADNDVISTCSSFDVMTDEDCVLSRVNSVTPESPQPVDSGFLQPFGDSELAVKMMFNYDAESNAPSILRAMNKEIVPAKSGFQSLAGASWETRHQKKQLPPHPNIVDMQSVFADSVPYLPQAMTLYPDALPRRLYSNGSGRNMTLFLVMKRYHCSLREYLKALTPNDDVSLLLLTQLLEGVNHMVCNGVAHRDLKTDNVLLDLSMGDNFPQLVITDFGCCLADSVLGLRLPYYTEETDKGGNSALMAPEVACAQPGSFSSINYEQADTWAVGTLAYEIFGQQNPFYEGSPRLDSRSYKEEMLPLLKADTVVASLVKDLLRRNPNKRLTPSVASNICHLLLWGPRLWFSPLVSAPSSEQIMQWLVHMAAAALLAQHSARAGSKLRFGPVFRGYETQNYSDLHPLIQSMVVTFLTRVSLREVEYAVHYIRDIYNCPDEL